ncbi:MAG TPA: peptidylprolyl isomerase [Candidatus Acidoferrum sp.]|nr:peptidylprolyl isomerase [Candidatus Acidoferrum sp.]
MFRSLVVLTVASFPMLAADTPPNVKVVEEIAAKVNGDIITRGELERKKVEIEAEARRQGLNGQRLQETVTEYTANALRDQIDQLLLVQKAKDLNINVDNEVTRYLAQIQLQQKSQHPELADPDRFQSFIREQTGMTFEDFKQMKKNELLTQRVIGQEVMRNITIPEPEMQKYYEEHKGDFVRKDAQVFLSQIVISTDGKTPEQVAAAEKKAKDVAARAKKGDKFADLARDFSDDLETGRNGGYIGAMPFGTMDKSIEDVISKEKKGFVSDPIKLKQAYLILKIEDRFEAGQASFEEVKEKIQDAMLQPRVEPKARVFLSKLREDAFLEIKEGYTDSGAVPGKDTRWKEVAALKPQTTTKEEVAARRKKKILWVIPNGYAKSTKTSTTPSAAPATAQPAAAAPAGATPAAATPDKPADKK